MSHENSYLSPNINPCKHESKNLFKIKTNISVCFGCSNLLYTNELGQKIYPVKPKKYNAIQETATPIFLSLQDTHCPYRFCNKESYLE